jgi:hypothetical protein
MAEKRESGSQKIDRKSISIPADKTANWPANPGPKQPKDRGVGIPKIPQAVLEDF